MSDAAEILRARGLRFWLNVHENQPLMEAELYQGGKVQGKLIATDSECNRFRVDNLQTVMGMHKHAVLRCTDIDKLELDWPKPGGQKLSTEDDSTKAL